MQLIAIAADEDLQQRAKEENGTAEYPPACGKSTKWCSHENNAKRSASISAYVWLVPHLSWLSTQPHSQVTWEE